MKTTLLKLIFLSIITLSWAHAANSQFAIYYAWPSVINFQKNHGNLEKVYEDLKQFEGVVFADGLQNPSHPDHQFSKELFGKLTKSGTKVFGYIGVGVNTMWNLKQVEAALQNWSRLPISGLLLDEAGYDFHFPGESEREYRKRINATIKLIHRKGLSVVLNAHNPSNLLGEKGDTHRSELNSSDYYLYESYLFSWSPTAYEYDFHTYKIAAIRASKEKYGFKIIGMATTDLVLDEVPQEQIDFMYVTAAIEGVDVIGMAPYLYSADQKNAGKIVRFFPSYKFNNSIYPRIISNKEQSRCVEFSQRYLVVDYSIRELIDTSSCR